MGGIFGGVLDWLMERLGGTPVTDTAGFATSTDAQLYGCAATHSTAVGVALCVASDAWTQERCTASHVLI